MCAHVCDFSARLESSAKTAWEQVDAMRTRVRELERLQRSTTTTTTGGLSFSSPARDRVGAQVGVDADELNAMRLERAAMVRV